MPPHGLGDWCVLTTAQSRAQIRPVTCITASPSPHVVAAATCSRAVILLFVHWLFSSNRVSEFCVWSLFMINGMILIL